MRFAGYSAVYIFPREVHSFLMNPDNNQSTEKKTGADTAKKVGRAVLKTADTVFDVSAGAAGAVFKAFGSVLLILLISGLLFACVFAYYIKTCLTPELSLSLEDYKLSQSSTIYYADPLGQWQELTTISGEENRIWVDYEDIPWYMEKAVVAIEDKRFYDHKGVDWFRTSGAFVKMFATMQNNYGGSTITQQLIKNLTGEDQITVMRKLTEIFSALELEKNYTKEEIIEWYLNAVYFGESCYGVETAAQTYFGKDVWELDLAECAAIVGITNKPTYYDPFYNEQNNKQRQETILREMYEQGYIDYETYKSAVNEPLIFTHSANQESAQEIYSYYEEVVIDDVITDLMELKGISRNAAYTLLQNGGYQIYSCLNTDIQAIVDSVYTDLSQIPRTYYSEQQLQSAIVVIEPTTGKIMALSGGVGQKNQNFPLNRATQTTRSPGSSFKPLASYGPAVEYGLITPSTEVDDSPDIMLSGTSWYPHNDSYQNYGVLTIFEALQYSLNTVAAQIVDKLSPQVCYNFLTERLGFTTLVPDDASYAPMALGQLTYGASVREMAQAYASFANEGVFTYSRTYTLITDSEGNVVIDNQPKTISAFSSNTAHVMTYMMQNAVNYGTGYEAHLSSMPVAGKTGTSGSAVDRWFCGTTPYYTAAVWCGYDTPEYISVSGNPAAQLWKKVMSQIHIGLEYKSFTYPYLAGPTGIFDIDEDHREKDEEEEEETTGTETDVEWEGSGSETSGGNTGGEAGGDSGDSDNTISWNWLIQ